MDLESLGCRRTGSRPAESVGCRCRTASGEGTTFARLKLRHLDRIHRRIVRWPKGRPAAEPFIVEVVKLYQRSLILTRFTPVGFAAIFAASQERVAPRCQPPQAARDAAGGKNRPALAGGANRRGRGPRELLGGACPPSGTRGSRIAPRAAPARRADVPHETGQYQRPLV